MIDYDRIVSVIMRRTGKSRDEAWDGLMEAYLTVDRNRSEPEQASYLIINGSLKALMDNYDLVHKATVFECEMGLDPDQTYYDNVIVEADNLTDMDYIIELISDVPVDYKIPVAVVAKALLSNGQRKPLTVEATRQLLKASKIPNTSETARQVYTFLTTLRRQK